jgi:hypothetical protein
MRIGRSLAHVGHRHRQWSCVPAQSGVDLDTLCTLELNGAGREVDGTDVVAVDKGALHQWSVELLK